MNLKKLSERNLLSQSNTIIIGAAGTGKTFLITNVINNSSKKKILVAAPTNQALNLLKNKIYNKNVSFKTLHSMLRYKAVFKGDKKYFITDESVFDYLNNYDYIVIDEASMISSKMLKKLEKIRVPIIYLGDENQLPPVGESYSPVFQKNYNKIVLTEIKRQDKNNPIVKLSENPKKIVKAIKKGDDLRLNTGILSCSNEKFIIDVLAAINNPNKLIYLAYRNKRLNEINQKVKDKIGIKDQVHKKIPMITNGTWKEIAGSTLFIPEKIEKRKRTFVVVKDKNTLKYEIKYYLINDTYRVINKDFVEDFEKMLEHAKKVSIPLYYNYKDFFTPVSYAWAISVHKSQGSTYENAVIDFDDINKSDNDIKNALMYVALTRARKLNIILKSKK